MADSTSPDDVTAVTPPGLTTFVVPDMLSRHLAEWLASQGFVVAQHPQFHGERTFLAVPSDALREAVENSRRFVVEYPTNPFEPVRIVDRDATLDLLRPTHVAVEVFNGEMPDFIPLYLSDPESLPPYASHDGTHDGTCGQCGHTTSHWVQVYRPVDTSDETADHVSVVFCSPECDCRALYLPPSGPTG